MLCGCACLPFCNVVCHAASGHPHLQCDGTCDRCQCARMGVGLPRARSFSCLSCEVIDAVVRVAGAGVRGVAMSCPSAMLCLFGSSSAELFLMLLPYFREPRHANLPAACYCHWSTSHRSCCCLAAAAHSCGANTCTLPYSHCSSRACLIPMPFEPTHPPPIY
jgi:hypothetical protein